LPTMKSSRIVIGVSLVFSAALRCARKKLRLPTTLSRTSRDVRPMSFIVFSSLTFFVLTGLIDDDTRRRGLEAVARVAFLWAVGDRHKQVYFGPEVVEIACTTCRFFDLHGTVRFDLHSHERNEGIGNLSRVESMGS